MSLGQELAPHLPFVRRFGRALLGSQKLGDAVVRHVLQTIIQNPGLVREIGDARIALYTIFHDTMADAPLELMNTIAAVDREGEPHELNEEIFRKRFEGISASGREALLLTALEGFTSEDAARITHTDSESVDARVAEALLEIERQTYAKVLIIEDEPIAAMDLESIVQDLGHDVVGIATTSEEAQQLDSDEVGLVIADVQLRDGSSGIDAVAALLARRQRPVIFITAFPEQFLDRRQVEPTFLITKPYQRSTVKAAVAQALFFNAASIPEEVAVTSATQQIEARQIAAKAGPVNAEVRNGQLRIVDSTTAEIRTDFESLDGVRKLHLRTAKHLVEGMAGSNAVPRIQYRLESIGRTLARPLTKERILQLGIQARGFEGTLLGALEFLDDETFADLNVFATDHLNWCANFLIIANLSMKQPHFNR